MPNITVRIEDVELVKKAKIIAAKQGKSVSAIVRAFLEDLVSKDEKYELAMKSALQTIHQGVNLGGRPLERDEVYDERLE
jgi:plasmid stability protein